MALYRYVKQLPRQPSPLWGIASTFCILSGISLLFWVLFPILSFEFVYASKFHSLVAPFPKYTASHASFSDISRAAPVLGTSTFDYTKASIWFPKAVNIRLASTGTSYTLSIPKLRIDNALVSVGGEDLDKSLIHFTGALPGQIGNPIVFGHSTLPFLYNPKNYTSIFSKLPDLNEGDTLFASVDGVTYTYRVVSMTVVDPDDVAVLEQRYDNAFLTLVTCVPPGTYRKRLIVRSVLEDT